MLLVDSFAQAYRWPLEQILSMTMPQIIMLNAAADVNRQRLDKRIKVRRQNGTASIQEEVAGAPVFNGKRLDELTTEEYLAYQRSALM